MESHFLHLVNFAHAARIARDWLWEVAIQTFPPELSDLLEIKCQFHIEVD